MLMVPMIVNVDAAFLDWGYRNAGTPSEIASTPVKAVVPAANARRTKKMLNDDVACRWASALWAIGHPSMHFTNPVTNSVAIDAMNKYVGTAKNTPDSLTPRRFIVATNAMKSIAISILR
jgi:hypothetical protein